MSYSRLNTFIFLLAYSFVCSASQNNGLTIKPVSSCYFPNVTTEISKNDLSYWQHISHYPGEFSNLKYKLASYQLTSFVNSRSSFSDEDKLVSKKKFSDNTSCFNQEITLVKKLIHNKRQHANGVEVNLQKHQLTFADLNLFKMRFSLKSQAVSLGQKQPFTKELHKNKVVELTQKLTRLLKTLSKSSALTDAEVMELRDKLVNEYINLKIIFYGENHSDYKIPTIYGEASIAISPTFLSEPLLELQLNQKSLNTYWQQNWQETPAALSELSQQPILGFILVAETPSGKTLESLTNALPKNITDELFIEHFIKITMFDIAD